MTHTPRIVVALVALLAAVSARGQEPPVPPPVEEQSFPPVETLIRPAAPEVPPRFRFEADVGAGTLGHLRGLRPAERFAARWWLFPIPAVEDKTAVTGRVALGYQFRSLPLSAAVSWEGYAMDERATLLGYDPRVSPLVNGLNAYNADQREAERPGHWPTLQMRDSASESMLLRSRATANAAGASAAWKVWTPREASGVEYRLIGGGRYAGIFTDDRADGFGYAQRASNWFAGGGPEGGVRFDVDFSRFVVNARHPAFLHLDARGGVLFGETVQRFREADHVLGGSTPYREFVQRGNRKVPFLSVDTGVMTGNPYMRWGVGVRYAKYWGVGNVGPSERDFEAFTVYLRVQAGF